MNNQKQKYFLKASIILKYLITEDDKIDTLITCKSSEVGLVTTDFDVYTALASVKTYDNLNMNKLKKLFEVVEVISYSQINKRQKPLLKESDVEKIREQALGVKNDRKENSN